MPKGAFPIGLCPERIFLYRSAPKRDPPRRDYPRIEVLFRGFPNSKDSLWLFGPVAFWHFWLFGIILRRSDYDL